MYTSRERVMITQDLRMYEAEGVRGSAARTLAGQRLVSGTVWCSRRFENMIPHPTAALLKDEFDIFEGSEK
jgi:hypothetical protein